MIAPCSLPLGFRGYFESQVWNKWGLRDFESQVGNEQELFDFEPPRPSHKLQRTSELCALVEPESYNDPNLDVEVLNPVDL